MKAKKPVNREHEMQRSEQNRFNKRMNFVAGFIGGCVLSFVLLFFAHRFTVFTFSELYKIRESWELTLVFVVVFGIAGGFLYMKFRSRDSWL